MTHTLPTGNEEHLGNDRASDPEIVVCPDGPLLIRGGFEILSTTGEKLPRHRQTVALCRCGASGIKPYCDGTHKLIGFRSDPESPGS